MQILDITNKQNIINIFGVGGTFQKFNNFYPYMYVLPEKSQIPKIIEKLEMDNDVKEIVIVEKYLPIGFQTETKTMLKIYSFDPISIRNLRHLVKNTEGIKEIFEADILYKNRFMIDMEIGSLQNINSNCEIINKESNQEMKVLSIDLEMLIPEAGVMPKPENDKIILASLSFSPKYGDNETLVLIASNNLPDFKDVVKCENEKSLIWMLSEIIQNYDPDIITGYNIDEFDFPYLNTRYGLNHLSDSLGRDHSNIYVKKMPLKTEIKIVGRVVLDLLPLIRKNYNYQNYTLRTVSKELLKMEKLDLDAITMKEYWESQNPDNLIKIVDYARRDALLALKLLEKTKLLDRFMAISKETGLLLQDCIHGGQTGKIEQLFLREFKLENRVMAMKPEIEENEDDNEESYDGATVLTPKKGLTKDVVVLDYKSLYPTIVISQNYSPDTIILDKQLFKDVNSHQAVVGGLFVDRNIKIGVMPKILERLLNERMLMKKEMKKYNKDTPEYDYYDARQYALKILLNSFYGYTGYKKARLFVVDIAQAVTSFGRENILKTQSMIDNIEMLYYKDGKIYESDKLSDLKNSRSFKCKVIYGDTDSLFIEIKEFFGEYGNIELDIIKLIGEKIAEMVTKRLPEPMALLYEKIAKRIVIEQKKKYAYLRYDFTKDGWKSEIATSGLETKRRDWVPKVGQTLKDCITEVLERDNLASAKDIAAKTIKEIIKMEEFKELKDIEPLILTRKYSKHPTAYKVKPAHIKLVEKMINRGESVTVGDRIQYLVYKGRDDNPLNRIETPEYILKNNLKIDTKYYIEKQFFPPLKRFLGVMGITDWEIWQDAPRPKPFYRRNRKGYMSEFQTQKTLLDI